jgi:hypothetical protein
MKQNTKDAAIAVLKVSVGIVAGVAAAAVVGATIRGIVSTEDMTKANKVIFRVGVAIIGAMAADAASEYAVALIDGFLPKENMAVISVEKFVPPPPEME